MSLPVVAIVGRPNVGKSSLFNRLVGRRISIVEATPGVTRDRVCAPLPVGEGYVELVDTGGMGIEDADDLTDHVEGQIAYALSEATLVLFVVDAREGMTSLDRFVADRLRRLDKPVLLLANKTDEPDLVAETAEFSRLGYGEPLSVSANHGVGIEDLLSKLDETVGPIAAEQPDEAVMKLAVVGKRNAGKSTLINALAGSERVIVSETPGTTRDSVDVTVELDGRRFTVIDTAGVRKKRKLADEIEFYSYHRALRSIRRADVVAFVIDASVPVSQVDKALSGQIADEFKPVVLVVNKWDLAREAADGEDYADYLAKTFPHLAFAPVSLTSAIDALNVRETVHLAEQIFRQSRSRISTGQLNQAMAEILALRGPSHKAGTKPPKIYYTTQISTAPPTIVCFVNDVRSFDRGYQRFLVNRLREMTVFEEVPIRLLFRQHRQTDGDRPDAGAPRQRGKGRGPGRGKGRKTGR